jgi:hypothetical protein
VRPQSARSAAVAAAAVAVGGGGAAAVERAAVLAAAAARLQVGFVNKKYFYSTDNKKKEGPVSWDELAALYHSQIAVTPDTFVWYKGMGASWSKVKQLPELYDALRAKGTAPSSLSLSPSLPPSLCPSSSALSLPLSLSLPPSPSFCSARMTGCVPLLLGGTGIGGGEPPPVFDAAGVVSGGGGGGGGAYAPEFVLAVYKLQNR